MTVALELEGMANGGEAIGRHEGKAVFVPYGIPGERVTAELVEERPTFARARIVDVLRQSERRVAPLCPHFGPGLCGGCQWQHIEYSFQLELKARIVRDALQRIGHVSEPPVETVLGMDEPWRYRNNVQLLVQPDGALAYQAAASNRPVTVSVCPIAHPLLGAMVQPGASGGPWRLPAALASARPRRVALRAGVATGRQMMVLETEQAFKPPRQALEFSLAWGPPGRIAGPEGQPSLEERLGGRTFRVSPASFFQVNTAQAERLVELVTEYAALQDGENLLDLFCGVGVFGILLAGRAGQVTGIEESPSAVADARVNATGLGNVNILRGQAERVMPSLEGRVDVAVLDPPRQGCAPAVLAALIRLSPRRIVYVSCDPATFARDVAALAVAGYRLARVTPVDMFPQTYHVESVARIDRP